MIITDNEIFFHYVDTVKFDGAQVNITTHTSSFLHFTSFFTQKAKREKKFLASKKYLANTVKVIVVTSTRAMAE